jgi:DNA-binding transcriptional ArsR family regulator
VAVGVWRVSADGLANSRFTVSALAETVAALSALTHGGSNPALRDWENAHRPAFRARVAEDRFAGAFAGAAFGRRWVADFIVIPPERGDRGFYDELRHVRATPAEDAYRDLAPDGPLPDALHVPDVATRAADVLEWVWVHTLRREWPRRRRIFEADIVARTQRLGSGGWAAALDGMRPGMRWLGDGTLRINGYHNPPRDLAGADLMFIPTTARPGWVSWDEPHRYAIVYPCAGLLGDDAPAPSDTLTRLIGPLRARILIHLAEPRTTSQLVALTGAALGSVGGHLKVLLDAELVRRRRAGRGVLYYRTGLGDALAGRTA